MNFIIDLIIVLIIMLCVWISAKKGFVKTIVGLVGFILVTYLSFTLSSPLAGITYDKIIEPVVIRSVGTPDNTSEDMEKVSEEIENISGAIENSDININDLWDSLPAVIKENAEKLGLSKEELDTSFDDFISAGKELTTKNLSQEVIKPFVTRILEMIYSIIIMIVLMFIINIIASIINKLFTFSLVGSLNKILGGVVGFPKGIIYSILFCMIVSLAVKFSGGFWILTEENLDKTILFELLANIIPFN